MIRLSMTGLARLWRVADGLFVHPYEPVSQSGPIHSMHSFFSGGGGTDYANPPPHHRNEPPPYRGYR